MKKKTPPITFFFFCEIVKEPVKTGGLLVPSSPARAVRNTQAFLRLYDVYSPAVLRPNRSGRPDPAFKT